MHFNVKKSSEKVHIVLLYRPEDYSFDIEPKPNTGGASLLINDAQLEIDENGRVLYVWGMCPHTTWSETTDRPPEPRYATLHAELPDDFEPGMSIRINNELWPISVNKKTGWVKIGKSGNVDDCVEFASGMIACLVSGELTSVWLRPLTLPVFDGKQ